MAAASAERGTEPELGPGSSAASPPVLTLQGRMLLLCLTDRGAVHPRGSSRSLGWSLRPGFQGSWSSDSAQGRAVGMERCHPGGALGAASTATPWGVGRARVRLQQQQGVMSGAYAGH